MDRKVYSKLSQIINFGNKNNNQLSYINFHSDILAMHMYTKNCHKGIIRVRFLFKWNFSMDITILQ